MENTSKNSARDFFLYLLAIITLYISVWRFIDLLFEYINALLPDQLNNYYNFGSYDEVRWSISSLLIVFPVYIGITWFLRKDAIAHPEKRELRVRKWLLNLTLFLAAITIIVDLVALVNNFLNGELTLRFFLKVLVVLIVAGSVFAYYFWDLRRETLPSSKPSKRLAILASSVIGISIVSGFFIIGSPGTQRMKRFDERRVSDLQILQNELINYWVQKNKLPAELAELKNDISGFVPPLDPETSASYEYKVLQPLAFELCASFSLEAKNVSARGPYYTGPYGDAYGQNWEHEKGRVCFARTIDPDLYRNRFPKSLMAPY